MLHPACNADAVRFKAGELHRVANLVAPQPGIGGNHQGVVFVKFHFVQRQGFGLFPVQLFHRDELVKNTVIQHQQHIVRTGAVLDAKKPFRSVVNFHVAHRWRRNQFLGEQFAIRVKRHRSVRKNLQIGPHFEDVFLARQFQYPADQHDCPRGHAQNAGHVFVDGGLRHFFDFLLPLVHQRNVQSRCADELRPDGQVFHHHRRHISVKHIRVDVAGLVAAADGQAFARKRLGIRAVVDENGDQILAALEMARL